MAIYKDAIKTSFIALLIICSLKSNAQQLLNRATSIEVVNRPIAEVLGMLSNEGNFYFSYNTNIIKGDSLVSIKMMNKTLKEVLQTLFSSGYEFRESGNYIILRRIPIRLRMVTNQAQSEDKYYAVTGFIVDDQTGDKVSDASIYDKQNLVSTISNSNGYFKLRLRSRHKVAALTISKEFYEDTTVVIKPAYNQELLITLIPLEISESTITISPQNVQAPASIELEIPISDSARWLYTYIKRDSVLVEKTALGKWLVSSRQRIQTINLHRFFTARPYQVSLTPGLSTNGKLNSQVINKFSLNLFGGYSGGVLGFELGGLFNIDKKNVQWVQIGGLFNLVGENMNGLQVAGLSNTVLNGGYGFQLGGINNFAGKGITGVQIGGVYNHSGHNTHGLQLAGVANFTNRKTKGAQIAGVANISSRETRGVQIAGIFNYTRRLKGVQIGLINVSDTSDGYSIGLINIVAKGYHKLSLSTNEVMDVNAAFKTGNSKLYSILLGGYNTVTDAKIWSFGYGLGTEMIPGRRFSLNTELTSQHLYLGSWDYLNLLNRASLMFNIKFGKFFSIYGGPTYSVYVTNQHAQVAGYKIIIPPSSYHTNKLGSTVTGWFGWTAGVNFF